MGLGIEVFDELGNTIIDTSRHTTSILGHVQVNNAGTYTVNNPRFALGVPFFLTDDFYNGVDVKAAITGNTYTFTVKALQFGSSQPFKIIYGVY